VLFSVAAGALERGEQMQSTAAAAALTDECRVIRQGAVADSELYNTPTTS